MRVKRIDLLNKIFGRCKELGLLSVERRQGSRHEMLKIKRIQVAIPRHNQISEGTARRIMKTLEPELGKDWWKNA